MFVHLARESVIVAIAFFRTLSLGEGVTSALIAAKAGTRLAKHAVMLVIRLFFEGDKKFVELVNSKALSWIESVEDVVKLNQLHHTVRTAKHVRTVIEVMVEIIDERLPKPKNGYNQILRGWQNSKKTGMKRTNQK